MKKQMYLLTCLSFLFLVSCEKSSNNNNIDLEAQEWFKNLKVPCDENTICKVSIIKAKYNGEVVYYTSLTGALCDAVSGVNLLNFDGELVKSFDYTEMSIFLNEVTFIETIYRCDE